MKREERAVRLSGLVEYCAKMKRQDTEWITIYADLEAKEEARVSAAQWALDIIALYETLAELERYRTLLVKYEASMREGRTDDLLKRIAAACGHEGWIAAWALEMSAALADEEVKRT